MRIATLFRYPVVIISISRFANNWQLRIPKVRCAHGLTFILTPMTSTNLTLVLQAKWRVINGCFKAMFMLTPPDVPADFTWIASDKAMLRSVRFCSALDVVSVVAA